MTFAENIVYYAWCVLTLGAPWLTKIIIKKALIEAQQDRQA